MTHYRCFLSEPKTEQLLVFACQPLARAAHPSGNLAIMQRFAPLTAGSGLIVTIWPLRGAALTRNFPSKIPITECSLQTPMSAVNTDVL